MKRSLLFAGGTVGGLGAVLAITPPQFTSSTQLAIPTATSTPKSTATAAPTKQPTKQPTKPAATSAPTSAPTVTPAAPTPSGVTGSFTGKASSVYPYGVVQVKITVSGGKIIDAQAIKAPTGRNISFTQGSVPYLRQQTIAAQSANIQGVSGASYTSGGWRRSLASALSKAGL